MRGDSVTSKTKYAHRLGASEDEGAGSKANTTKYSHWYKTNTNFMSKKPDLRDNKSSDLE